MSSPSESIHLDRKELKRPDRIAAALMALFDGLVKNKGALVALLILGVGLMAAAFAYRSFRQSKLEQAASSLYSITQAAQKALGDKADPKDLAPALDKLAEFAKQHAGTVVAYEALMFRANSFSAKGELAKSAEQYVLASEQTKEDLLKGAALLQAGLVLEDLGKHAEAAERLETLSRLKDKALRPLALVALSRNYRLLKDTTKEKETRELLLKEYPSAPFVRSNGP